MVGLLDRGFSIVCPLKLGCLGVVEDPAAVGRTTRLWSIVCPLKLGCLGVVEDPVVVGRTTRQWFSHCSYVLDLDLARLILPIQNI